MEQMAIFSATLGLSPPWKVTSASFAKDCNRLDITIEYTHGSPLDCPVCGGKGTSCHFETVGEIWYHDDFFRYVTYLHAQVPLMACCCGGRFELERPWSRTGSKFTLLD
jgi:transposase